MITCKEFYFIRHGETDLNLRRIYMGSQDIPLNENGIKQAENAANILKDIPFASIAVSPLMRTLKTAEIITLKKSVPVTIIENFKECNMGVLEGQDKGDGSLIRKWREGEIIENAETWEEFKERVKNALIEALQLPEPVLIVAHGGVYWALKQNFPYLPYIDLHNCQIMHHIPPKNDEEFWNVKEI